MSEPHRILIIDDDEDYAEAVKMILETHGYAVETVDRPEIGLQRALEARPDLIVLDGIDAFVDGGPMNGKRAKGNVFLASTDRVAIDAVGLAILQSLGSNDQIMNTKIFKQEQIARAAEIGLGATSPAEINVVAASKESRQYRDRVVELLNAG